MKSLCPGPTQTSQRTRLLAPHHLMKLNHMESRFLLSGNMWKRIIDGFCVVALIHRLGSSHLLLCIDIQAVCVNKSISGLATCGLREISFRVSGHGGDTALVKRSNWYGSSVGARNTPSTSCKGCYDGKRNMLRFEVDREEYVDCYIMIISLNRLTLNHVLKGQGFLWPLLAVIQMWWFDVRICPQQSTKLEAGLWVWMCPRSGSRRTIIFGQGRLPRFLWVHELMLFEEQSWDVKHGVHHMCIPL